MLRSNNAGFGVLTTILTIYRSGLRGNYGFCSTKKHGFRTKKHVKARKMRQKTDAFAFGTSMPQVRILSLRPKFVLYAPKKSVLFVRLGLIFCSLSPTCSLAKRPQFSAKRFLSAQDTGFVRFYKHFECFWEIPFLCLLRRKF